jgi:hypothetical protein
MHKTGKRKACSTSEVDKKYHGYIPKKGNAYTRRPSHSQGNQGRSKLRHLTKLGLSKLASDPTRILHIFIHEVLSTSVISRVQRRVGKRVAGERGAYTPGLKI